MLPVPPPTRTGVLLPLQAADVRDRVGSRALDDLAALAALVCDAPVGVLSLTEGERQVVGAVHGLPHADARTLVCAEAAVAEANGVLIVPYTVSDTRVSGAQGLLSAPAIRACVVVVVESAGGQRVGTLGIFDFRPRNLLTEQLGGLISLARHAATLFEHTLSADERTAARRARTRAAGAMAFDEVEQHHVAAVMEALPDLVAVADLEGRIVRLNAAGVAMSGVPASGGGRTLSDLHPPERQAQLEAGIAGALRHGLWRGDNVLAGPDGAHITVSQVIVAPRDDEGRPECLATFVRDVTEFRRQNERLRLSEHRFRQVVDNVADVLFEQDVDGRWTFLNPAWSEATGFAVEDSLGRHFLEFVHPDDAGGAQDRFGGLLTSGDHEQSEPVRYLTLDGHFRWMEARVRRVSDGQGAPVGTIGTLRDVTAQRAMADEIARAHKQAVKSSAMMSEFLANMSHEIRTPLNGVLGLNSILLETSLSDEQQQLATGAQHSAETLLALVNDILDLSKIEAGSLILERVPFEIRQWATEVAEPGFTKARSRGLDVRLDVSPELPRRLMGDPTRTRQILSNLIDNAVKFTAAGTVSVVAVPDAGPEGRRMLRVSVTDSGIGIPHEKQAVVFEKYRQADSSTTRRYGGTGLGLAICRQLATLMDGEIGLDSAEGRGSTFWFTVPLVSVDEDDDVAAAPGAHAAAASGAPAPRVLLVEDNPTNQFVARKFLEKAGCVVSLAGNGAEALDTLATEAFDLVFMDCQMPVMDGYEATRRIRHGSHCPTVPIIAMTAHAMTGDRERCLGMGMTEYLSKPLKAELVAEMVDRLLRRDVAAPA